MSKHPYNGMLRAFRSLEAKIAAFCDVDGMPVFCLPDSATPDEDNPDLPPPFPGMVLTWKKQALVVLHGRVWASFRGTDDLKTHKKPLPPYALVTDDEQRNIVLTLFSRAFKVQQIHTGLESGDQWANSILEIGNGIVWWLNRNLADQSLWVVEQSPKHPPARSKFVRRIHERERLLLWTDRKVNTTFRKPVPALAGDVEEDSEQDYERTLAAHRRRGHWKTLRSPRWTHKQGQRIWVNACWVGPQEMVVGHERYRVRLDL